MKYHLMQYPIPPRRPEKPKPKLVPWPGPLADENTEPVEYGFMRL